VRRAWPGHSQGWGRGVGASGAQGWGPRDRGSDGNLGMGDAHGGHAGLQGQGGGDTGTGQGGGDMGTGWGGRDTGTGWGVGEMGTGWGGGDTGTGPWGAVKGRGGPGDPMLEEPGTRLQGRGLWGPTDGGLGA